MDYISTRTTHRTVLKNRHDLEVTTSCPQKRSIMHAEKNEMKEAEDLQRKQVSSNQRKRKVIEYSGIICPHSTH